LDFAEGKYRILISIGKVEAGADFRNVNVAVNFAYYSKATRMKQKKGRALRIEGDKTALIVNLYCRFHPSVTARHTLERSWLTTAQKGSLSKIKWMDNIEDLIADYEREIGSVPQHPDNPQFD
jgi:ERCC4-related helicase